jgi:asparagine synthase (glutamine-hydrolysing)
MRGWLGHRRLRVIDLSEAAHQPMSTHDGKVVLTYNGEVYNFRELRRSLESQGHEFSSTGDTEVVLRAYEAWGADFVERIDGMFALAIWDARLGRLLLARDRTGKKPLFYTEIGGRLTFGSEIKALLAAPWVERAADPRRLAEFLTYGYVPHPHTMFAGVRQLAPATLLLFDGTGPPVLRSYWDPLPEDSDKPPGIREQHEQLPEILERATRRRMIADVPMGALLSGGIDSSIVVGLMARNAEDPVRTFSAGFSDDVSFDERRYAKIVSERFGTRHEEFNVRADAAALLDRLLWHHDQPFADSSAIPTYLVCELARQRVTVVLNGDGGDEVFGGYDRFVAVALADALPSWPLPALHMLSRLLPRNHGYFSLRRRVERFIESGGAEPRARYASWIAVMNEQLLEQLLPPELIGNGTDSPEASMADCYLRAASLPMLDQVLYANFKTYLPDDLAVKMDRMSMAHALETRSPFLDTAIIEYLARIPAKQKVGLRRLKPVLRRAFWPMLPREIWNRRKHGFGVPVGLWFQEGDLRQMFEDEVLSDSARSGQYLDSAVVHRMWDEHQQGTVQHGFRFWTLLTLERWLRGLERPVELEPPRLEVTA